MNSNGTNAVGIPVADSLNTYSSAFEVFGEPPTYETNHALIPFVAPSAFQVTTTVNGTAYKANAICPNYSTTGTSISAPISSGYAAVTGWTGLNIYSTAFPGQVYQDGLSSSGGTVNPAEDTSGLYTTNTAIWMTANTSTDIYPPTIAGCTASYSAQNGGVTPTADDPWWNWANNTFPGTSNTTDGGSNCANENSTKQTTFNTGGQPTYNNCTLLIQTWARPAAPRPTSRGTAATRPCSRIIILVVKTSTGTILALDPIYNGASWYDLIPGVITSQLHSIDSKISVSTTIANYITDSDTAASYNTSGTVSSYGFTPIVRTATRFHRSRIKARHTATLP